jgi:hypothetical protein
MVEQLDSFKHLEVYGKVALFPLLYAIQASMLSFQLDHSQHLQELMGLRISRGVRDINHAQFVDDTILLGSASIRSANKFKVELDKYQAISGSIINYRKSQIYGWNCTPREMTDITRILGIMGKTQWDSFKYLGVPIFKASTKSSCWAPLVDKIKARISAWGSSWLNPAGKLVLIKSVLSSIPIYQCSILLAPKGIISKIEALLVSLPLERREKQ